MLKNLLSFSNIPGTEMKHFLVEYVDINMEKKNDTVTVVRIYKKKG